MGRFQRVAVMVAAVVGAAAGTGRADDPVRPEPRLTIKGHTNDVIAVALSPDGKLLASAGYDRTIRVWNTATGERKERIPHTDEIFALVFTPDGKTVLAGGRDKAVTYWDAASGEKMKTVKDAAANSVGCLAVAPDGSTFAVVAVESREIRVFGLETGDLKQTLPGNDNQTNRVAYSPDGKTLASVGRDGTARIWDVATGMAKDELKAHDGVVDCVAFTADGKRLVTGGQDKTLIVWDLKKGNPVKPVLEGHRMWVPFVAATTDGKIVSWTMDRQVHVWTHPDPKPTVVDPGTGGDPFALGFYNASNVAVTADGRTLATSRGSEVFVYDLRPGEVKRVD